MDRIIINDSLQKINQNAFIALMEQACDPGRVLSQSQLITGLGIPAALRARGSLEAEWLCRPMFCALHQIRHDIPGDALSSTSKELQKINVFHAFQTMKDEKALEDVILEVLKLRLNRVLPGTFNTD